MLLDLLADADNGLTDAAQQTAGLQALPLRVGYFLRGGRVVRREEDQRQGRRIGKLFLGVLADLVQGARRRGCSG